MKAKHFVLIWQLSPTVEVAAMVLQIPVTKALALAKRLRKKGVMLKVMPVNPKWNFHVNFSKN